MNILSILQNKNNMFNTNLSMVDNLKEKENNNSHLDFHNFRLPPTVKIIDNYEICEQDSTVKWRFEECGEQYVKPILSRQYTLSPHKIHVKFEDMFIETINEIIIGVPYGWIPVCTDISTLCSELSDFSNINFNIDIEKSTIVWYKEK